MGPESGTEQGQGANQEAHWEATFRDSKDTVSASPKSSVVDSAWHFLQEVHPASWSPSCKEGVQVQGPPTLLLFQMVLSSSEPQTWRDPQTQGTLCAGTRACGSSNTGAVLFLLLVRLELPRMSCLPLARRIPLSVLGHRGSSLWAEEQAFSWVAMPITGLAPPALPGPSPLRPGVPHKSGLSQAPQDGGSFCPTPAPQKPFQHPVGSSMTFWAPGSGHPGTQPRPPQAPTRSECPGRDTGHRDAVSARLARRSARRRPPSVQGQRAPGRWWDVGGPRASPRGRLCLPSPRLAGGAAGDGLPPQPPRRPPMSLLVVLKFSCAADKSHTRKAAPEPPRVGAGG